MPGHADVEVALPASVSARVSRDATLARAHLIIDGLWGLQLPLCYESVASMNAYLVALEDGWMLVDCGSALAPGWAAVERALAQAGTRPEQVRLLVVSHAHADHRGLASEVVRQTGCRLATSEGPHPLLDSLRDLTVPLSERRAAARTEGVPELAVDRIVDDLPGDDRFYPAVEPDQILCAGEALPSRSGEWQVVPAPGHSADQITLWNAAIRGLISADLALPGPASYLEYGTRPDPHADQLGSLERALGLEPELLLPGHGRPIRDGVAFLADCREKVLGRAEVIGAALDAEPRTGWQLAAMITPPGADAGHWQRSLSEVLSVLEHLESRTLARHVIDDAGVRCWLAAVA
jgi:glyoxylase-like metal-dependent hydrolase (beta-lactamase superfamily II)